MKISGEFVKKCVESVSTKYQLDIIDKIYDSCGEGERDALAAFGGGCVVAGYYKGCLEGALATCGGIILGIAVVNGVEYLIYKHKEKKQEKNK